MGKFSGVLIACDYDNTLVYTTEALLNCQDPPPVSRENCEAIEYFMAEGGTFSMATGRALPAFVPVMDGIPMNGPTVIGNGAAIYDFQKEEYLCSSFLPESARPCISDVLDRFPFCAAEIYHDDNTIHSIHANEVTRHHAHITHSPTQVADSLDEVPSPISKALFECLEDDLIVVQNYIASCPWCHEFEVVPSSVNLLELTAKGANKGGMVQKLANILGVKNENLFCVGDHANDISMLEISRIPFAPANALDVVKAVPGVHVLPDCRENAIAAMIEYLKEVY